MYRLSNPVQHYAWGSHTALAELRGEPAPSVRPEAEMWLGAHPGAPSRVRDDGADRPLADVVAADPEAVLGAPVVRRFGPRLPFLFKVLAVDQPLSLQVHPNRDQAAKGYAAERARGMAADDPARNYRDGNHKPELLCALTDFDALCGLRPAAEIDEVLGGLGIAELRDWMSDGAPGLIRAVLTAPHPGRLVAAVLDACRRRLDGDRGLPESVADVYRCARGLGARYPDDPGVVVALLLNRVHLRPGQALYTPPGRLHAYLGGVGLEIMASSDNVLRGGLTAKHVDVTELLNVLEPDGGRPELRVTEPDGSGWDRYPAPDQDFALARATAAGAPVTSAVPGPQILLCTDGRLTATAEGTDLRLERGQSVFAPAGRPVTLTGTGTAYRASTG